MCTKRDETIKQLRDILNSAAEDLAIMPGHKQGSEWHLDRQRDVDFARRQLARLEANPAATT